MSLMCKGLLFEDLYLSTYSAVIPTSYFRCIFTILCLGKISTHDLELLSLHPRCFSDLKAAWLVLNSVISKNRHVRSHF